MTQAEIDAWADKAFADFERKETKREKEHRAEAWAKGNGYRQALLRSKPAAQEAVSDRIARDM